MTAASAAALAAEGLSAGSPSARLLGLAVVVLGGLIEGLALGMLQAIAWRTVLDPAGRRRWAVATTVVAGLGWAAASAPAALAGDSNEAPQASLVLILAGAAALGLAMGVLLGVGQALALRGQVPHPYRWVTVSALGWIPAMMVIFLGASAPSDSWPTASVVTAGALTGVVAGTVLGVVTGPLMGTLVGLGTSSRSSFAGAREQGRTGERGNKRAAGTRRDVPKHQQLDGHASDACHRDVLGTRAGAAQRALGVDGGDHGSREPGQGHDNVCDRG
jgi:hypothetical protein